MIPRTYRIPALAVMVFAFTLLIIVPLISVTEERNPREGSLAAPDATSCSLPPSLDLQWGGVLSPSAGLPRVDEEKNNRLERATFALG